MHPLFLFLGFLKHIDVLGGARCTTIVGQHLRDEVDNIERMETYETQLEMIHERLGGDVGVDGLSMPDLADPCLLGGIDDEGATAVFGSLVELEIVPHQFVGDLGSGADNESGAIWYHPIDGWMCGRVKRLGVSRFVSSVGR